MSRQSQGRRAHTIEKERTVMIDPLPQDADASLVIADTAITTQTMPSETTWIALYNGLRAFVTSRVRDFPVPSWLGQEADVIDDIVQESMRKIFERLLKAEQGTATPVQSLMQISMTIAYNTYRDFRRHDRRFYHVAEANATYGPLNADTKEHPLEQVIEKIYQEQVFSHIALSIAGFPVKQKQALLMDLANRMAFSSDEATPLQDAFDHAGITIQEYVRSLPADKAGRYRHASILNHAYKRIHTIINPDNEL
jgi:DNA-directed RNA polymerase specialized sigma24 family protein